jgi:hypothetical protein
VFNKCLFGAAAIGIVTDGPAVRFGRARHATEVVVIAIVGRVDEGPTCWGERGDKVRSVGRAPTRAKIVSSDGREAGRATWPLVIARGSVVKISTVARTFTNRINHRVKKTDRSLALYNGLLIN